jgi:GTP-binding protein
LLNELKQYNPALLDKDRILAISKTDLITSEEDRERIISQIPKELPYVMISSILQQGLVELKDLLWKTLQDAQVNELPSSTAPEDDAE